MYTLKARNTRGDILNLNDNPEYNVISVEGLTPPNATINTSTLGQLDGETFNSARLNKRNIVIKVAPKRYIETNRIDLYKWFSPKQPVRIYYENGTRNVYVDGYTESFEGSLFNNPQTFTISIICPSAYLFASQQTVQSGSYTESLFEFPFSIEESGIEISRYDRVSSIIIRNESDIATGMTIELSASSEVVNPKIYRRDTLESFGLNYTMQEGDVIRIATKKGGKSVILARDGDESNIINAIDKNITWFQLEPGDNLFTYEATSGLEDLDITFVYDRVYAGV